MTKGNMFIMQSAWIMKPRFRQLVPYTANWQHLRHIWNTIQQNMTLSNDRYIRCKYVA